MSEVMTPGSLSESDARILSIRYVREKAGLPCAGGVLNQRMLQVRARAFALRTAIPDTDVDYPSERVELNLSDCVKRSESGLTPSEQRGRRLAAIRGRAETGKHPAVTEVRAAPKPLIERETWITFGFCGLAVIALTLTYFEVPFLIGQLFGSLR